MGAAYRLTSGYSRIDRAWSYSPKSPFAKRLRYYDVWEVLIEQAGYVGCKGMEPGVVQITLRQIAAAARLPTTTVARAIAWLRRHRWIVVQFVKRCHSILIPHYELLHDMDAYILSRLRGSIVENVDKSGTNPIGDNTTESKPVLRLVETKRYKVDKSDTNSASTKQSTTIENYSKKDMSKDALWTKAVQTPPFLKEQIHISINTYGETNAGIEGDETGKCSSPIATVSHDANNDSMDTPSKSSKRKLEPNQFDREIAETWAEGLLFIATQLAEERGRKPPKQKANIEAMAKVITALRVIDEYSEEDIILATVHRFEDDFYCDTPGLQLMGLTKIRQVSERSSTGFTRFENLLRAAYRAREMRKK